MLSCNLQQFGTMLCYQLLVGCADTLAQFQRLLRELVSSSDTAHGLTDDSYAVIL